MISAEQSKSGWYFLIIVITLLITTSILRIDLLIPSLKFSFSIFLKIIPVLILIFVILVLFNKFVKVHVLKEYLGKYSGTKGWIIAIITGIISTGPIYMWYPLLNELQKAGAKNGLLAAFLYNRAIKPALLPIMIFYFGIKFTIILTFVMIFFSIIQGIIIDKLVEVKI